MTTSNGAISVRADWKILGPVLQTRALGPSWGTFHTAVTFGRCRSCEPCERAVASGRKVRRRGAPTSTPGWMMRRGLPNWLPPLAKAICPTNMDSELGGAVALKRDVSADSVG